jgi:hypothetical protein
MVDEAIVDLYHANQEFDKKPKRVLVIVFSERREEIN